MDKEESGEMVYSVVEASRLLKLSRGATYEAVHSGQIPSIKIGRRILIPAAGLARVLEGQAASGPPPLVPPHPPPLDGYPGKGKTK